MLSESSTQSRFQKTKDPHTDTCVDGKTRAASTVSRVIGDAALALVGGIAGRALLYLSQFMLARWMGPTDFGLFALALNVTQLGSVVVGFGLYMAAVRFIAIYSEQGLPDRVGGLLKWTAASVLVASGLTSLTLVAWPSWWAGALREEGLVRVLPIMGAALPFLALTRLFASSLNGLGLARLRSMCESALPSLLLLVGIILLKLVNHLSLPRTAVLFIVAWGIATLVSGGVLLGRVGIIQRVNDDIDRLAIMRFALPAWGVALLNQLAQRMDVLLAGFFLGGADIGVYSAAAVVAVAMNFVMTAFNMAAAPSFATWEVRTDTLEVERLYREGTRLLLALGLPLGTILILGSGELMQLLGDQFQLGQTVLVVLVMGQIVNLGVGAAGNLLIMTGHQHVELLLVFSSVVVNVLLASYLVPSLGLVGLAISLAATVALLNLLRLALVYRLLHIHPYGRSYLKLLVAWAGAVSAGLLTRTVVCMWEPSALLILVAVTGVTGGAYLLAMVLTGGETVEREMVKNGWARIEAILMRLGNRQ
jgi:O-antigen/teichoic acid export membrane protein